jgi:hypothetical protein
MMRVAKVTRPILVDDLPEPLIDARVDLRDFPRMPIDVIKLLNSDTWAISNGWESKAAMNLWARSWHQVPAGSLPDDDNVLAALAGVPNWHDHRAVALRCFLKCNDGRLYHPVVCDIAKSVWAKRESYRTRAKKRWNKKKVRRAKHVLS